MGAAWLVLLALGLLIFAYITYSSYISKKLGVDRDRQTPAHTMYDGVDYVPAKAPVLLGHHFASIAGAAPIIGPVTAAVFGWIPVYLWIILGAIFIGAVHDFSALIASVRHSGRSIGEVIEDHIGRKGKRLFIIFAWSALVLIIAVFTIVVAKTFVSVPSAGTSSVLFILLAILFGFSIYRIKAPLGVATIVGVALLFTCVYVGLRFPLVLSMKTWTYILLGYIFVASVTPVWILLQPRDYLNSFLLYTLIAGAILGIFISNPQVRLPDFTSFNTNLGYLFPILFVTVACGAISGFHSLVASGTTAKQLDREVDARPVGYGGMLIEGLLAVVALTTAAILLKGKYDSFFASGGGGPITLFSRGVGGFMTKFGVPLNAGVTFAALSISAFALTSLDTATRLARFAFQEFFETGSTRGSILSSNRFVGTFFTVLAGGLLALSGKWRAIWPIFGSANQLLAALALLAVSVWLTKIGRDNNFVKYPMIFMFAVTLTALITLIRQNLIRANYPLAIIAFILLVVAIVLAVQANLSLRRGKP